MTGPKPPSTLFLSMDLEFEQPSQEIIQIGYCVGDLVTGEIVGEFSQLVTPKEALSPFIIQLCGITQSDMDRLGVPLGVAYAALLEDIKHYPTLNTNPLTWGGGDSASLREQVGDLASTNWPFGRRWLDIKTIFQFRQMANGLKPQAGLAKALTKMGLNFVGRKHNALADSINTFKIAHVLLKQMKTGLDVSK